MPVSLALALLISGEERGFFRARAGGHLSLAASRLARHVIDPLRQRDRTAVHSLLCLDRLPPPESNSSLATALQIRHWPAVATGLPAGHAAQAGRRLHCFQQLEEYEASRHLSTHVLLTRPDAVWYSDIPPLATFARNAFTVRARLLFSGGGTKGDTRVPRVSVDKLSVSYPPWFEGMCLTSGRSSPPLGTLAISSSSCHLSDIQGCVFADDQVAMLPRHLAPAFFTRVAIAMGALAPSTRYASCKPNGSEDLGGRRVVMRSPAWNAVSAKCKACGAPPHFFEGRFTQALLDGGCGLVVSGFGFIVPPDTGGARRNEVSKRQIFEFVKLHVLFNHSPITDAYRGMPQPVHPRGGWEC